MFPQMLSVCLVPTVQAPPVAAQQLWSNWVHLEGELGLKENRWAREITKPRQTSDQGPMFNILTQKYVRGKPIPFYQDLIRKTSSAAQQVVASCRSCGCGQTIDST